MVILVLKMGKRVFVMLVVCGIVVMVIGNLPLISAQFECGGDPETIGTDCGEYIQRSGEKTPPSPQCCEALKPTDVNCLCKYFGMFEMIFSTEKIVYVLNQCQKPLASGTKCGSKFLLFCPTNNNNIIIII